LTTPEADRTIEDVLNRLFTGVRSAEEQLMKSRARYVLPAVAGLVLTTVTAVPAAGSATPPGPAVVVAGEARGRPSTDARLTPRQRAARLVARMTLDEKIAEVHGVGYPLVADRDANYAGTIPGNSRLGIPAVYLADSPVGVGNGSTGVTQWADTAALASTWDTGLARRFGRAYGAEQAGKGHNVALGPTINILRLPNWGRAPETFSEDPYLTGHQAAAEIRGIQRNHVIATAKHFVANNQEFLRSSINVVAGKKARREIYEPAFKTSVRAGVGAIMCSYNRVGGTYACENAEELLGILRRAWHFDGMVMSDWGALHSTAPAANSGLDLEMPGADEAHPGPLDDLFGSYFNSRLTAAVQSGAVPMWRLDRMVRHILTAMIRIGLLDHPTPDPLTVKNTDVSTPAHQALSARIAEQGAVLLKNTRGILPLSAHRIRSVAVIGDAAKNPLTAAGGSAAVIPSAPVVTPLAGIVERAGSGTSVSYAQGTLGTNPLAAVPASAFGAGLAATYYPSADLSGPPVASETVPNLDLTGNPSAVGSRRTWSARYTGTITAPATGTYRFSLQAGGYVTVHVDGRQVVSFTPMFEPTQNGLVRLTAGAHHIRVEVRPFQHQLVTVEQFAVTPGLHLGWQPRENDLVARAAAAARAADAAVVVASTPASEGWDRRSLALPADQDALIAAVAAANPRTVVVLNTSSAVTMPWLHRVAGVVEVWYPGQTAGTSIARVLFGDVNPSGKLPVTFPASDRQGPARSATEYPGDGTNVYYREGTLVGYRWFDARHQRPLFPFGFGLSYTTFRFSGLRVTRRGHGYAVTARVTNTGARPGSTVAQLYVRMPRAAHEPPRQLKAYTKVHLRPSQTKTVNLRLPRRALAAWNPGTRWAVTPGRYRIFVGDSSRHLPLTTTIHS
jgi:beta-glucosidase